MQMRRPSVARLGTDLEAALYKFPLIDFVTYLWLEFGNIGVRQTLRNDGQTDCHTRDDVALQVGESAESRNS